MVSITLSVPDETRKLMREFDEVNWSGFVRKAIEHKARQLRTIEDLKRQLATQEEVTDWSVKLQHASRTGRLAALKRKGLL